MILKSILNGLNSPNSVPAAAPPAASQPAAPPRPEIPAAESAPASDDYSASLASGSAQSAVALDPRREPDRGVFPEDPSVGQVTRNANRQANSDLSLAAALLSLADRRPEQITRLISHQGGDIYTVNFPGYDRPIEVKGPNPATSGSWVKMVEDAYRQTHADGSVPADPIFTLTGHYVDMTVLERHTEDETRSLLKHSLDQGKIVSAYDGAQHATYAVSCYDAEHDSVTLHAANRNERLTMTLAQFRSRFSHLNCES